MRNCPSPERGIFCILVIDLISKSALVLFKLLRASKHNCKKASCYSRVQNNTQRIIDYCISTVKIVRVSDRYFYFFSVRWNKTRYIICYFQLTYDYNIILDMFILECYVSLFFLQNIESVIYWYFPSQSFE